MRAEDILDNLCASTTPIPLYASSWEVADLLRTILETDDARDLHVSDQDPWKTNPLLKAIGDAAVTAENDRERAAVIECMRVIKARAFLVRTDDSSISELGLRVGLGEIMRQRWESGHSSNASDDAFEVIETKKKGKTVPAKKFRHYFALEEVDEVCGGSRLPNLSKFQFRQGSGPGRSTDYHWHERGSVVSAQNGGVAPEGMERGGTRGVVDRAFFPCLIPFFPNRYPVVNDNEASGYVARHPFSHFLAERMRSLAETSGDHALLMLAPGVSNLSEEAKTVIETLSGFDYEHYALEITRPNRRNTEVIALCGVLESKGGINLMGYLLDSIGRDEGAEKRMEKGLEPLWKSYPIRSDYCPTIRKGMPLDSREDWKTIEWEIANGRAIFRDRRKYMCVPSTDWILDVRIEVKPSGRARFERIRHSVEARRHALMELMPDDNGRADSRAVKDPTFVSSELHDGYFEYEDWVVGRRGFTRFLRENMDVIEEVKSKYVSDCCGRNRGNQFEKEYDLTSYVPPVRRRGKPDFYATGFRWSAYRILQRYGMLFKETDHPSKDCAHALKSASGMMEELGALLEGRGE